VSVKVVLCARAPLTAFTVTVYVPVGVPGFGGGAELPLPPPQPTPASKVPKMSSANIRDQRRRRTGVPIRTIPAKLRLPVLAQNSRLRGECSIAEGAVVVTVIVVCPVPVTEDGLNVQVLSNGNPTHELEVNDTVPL
jgi:hypothetical protein